MKIKPIYSNVILKPISEEKVSKSGIVLPDTIDKEKPETAEIIAVGDGRLNDKGEKIPMSVKVGDKVMFKKYSPDEITVEGEDLLVIQESDIIAIIS